MLTCRPLTELLNGADNYSHLFFRKKGHNNQVSKLTFIMFSPFCFQIQSGDVRFPKVLSGSMPAAQ